MSICVAGRQDAQGSKRKWLPSRQAAQSLSNWTVAIPGGKQYAGVVAEGGRSCGAVRSKENFGAVEDCDGRHYHACAVAPGGLNETRGMDCVLLMHVVALGLVNVLGTDCVASVLVKRLIRDHQPGCSAAELVWRRALTASHCRARNFVTSIPHVLPQSSLQPCSRRQRKFRTPTRQILVLTVTRRLGGAASVSLVDPRMILLRTQPQLQLMPWRSSMSKLTGGPSILILLIRSQPQLQPLSLSIKLSVRPMSSGPHMTSEYPGSRQFLPLRQSNDFSVRFAAHTRRLASCACYWPM